MHHETDQQTENSSGLVSGLLNSIAHVAATVLSMLHTRLELLAVELQEEAQHVVSTLWWSLLALLVSGMGLLLAGVTVIIIFWDTHRILAAVCVTGTFLAIALLASLVVLRKIRNHPRMLQGTLEELKRDQALLRTRP